MVRFTATIFFFLQTIGKQLVYDISRLFVTAIDSRELIITFIHSSGRSFLRAVASLEKLGAGRGGGGGGTKRGFSLCTLKPLNVSSPAAFHHSDFVVILDCLSCLRGKTETDFVERWYCDNFADQLLCRWLSPTNKLAIFLVDMQKHKVVKPRLSCG